MQTDVDRNSAAPPCYADVYGDEDNWFFSEAVTRDFGVNCRVVMTDGSVVFNVVQPVNEYAKINLPVVGRIELRHA